MKRVASMVAGREVEYVGEVYRLEDVAGRRWGWSGAIGVVEGLGLVLAPSRRDLLAGRWLDLDTDAAAIIQVRTVYYRRDRGDLGERWFHGVDECTADLNSGAILGTSSAICHTDGSFLCEPHEL